MPQSVSEGSSGYLKIAAAAEWVGLTEKTLRRYVAAGKLPAYRVGPRGIRIKRSDLDALLTPIPAADNQVSA